MPPLPTKHGTRSVSRQARRRIALALGIAVLTAASCSPTAARATNSTNASSTTDRSSSTTAGSQTKSGFLVPEIKFGAGQAGPPDPTTSVPSERGTRAIDPSNDAGQEVIIAKGGYLLPEWLVAEVTLPVTWTNLSGVPQQVVFDDAPVRSDIIPPGGTFTWKSSGFAISLRYHTVNGHHATLTLQNPNIAP